jgi:replicative DNA helicase
MRSLVGESLVNPESAFRILAETRVSADDIEELALRQLWVLLEERVKHRRQIDAVGLREALKHEPAQVQTAAINVVVEASPGFAFDRLTALRERGIRRRTLEQLREVAKALNAGAPLAEVERLARATPEVLAGAGSRLRNCSGDALAMLDHLETVWSGRGTPPLRTGFDALDESVGGLIANLLVVGARTGVGKSALVAGLVRNWVTRGVKVGVLAYEDDARDMGARIAACASGVSVREVRGDVVPGGPIDGGYRKARLQAISEGLEWWHKHEHLVETDDARPAGTVADVLASIRQMHSRGCRVALLDNMTCVRLDGPDDRRHDLVLEAALSDIRGVAQELKMPVFVVGHLKRGQTDVDESRKPPKLSDFSNAAAWENYSRLALGMWRDGDDVALRVLKQTNGPAGDTFTLRFAREAAVVTGAEIRLPDEAPPKKPQRYLRGEGAS